MLNSFSFISVKDGGVSIKKYQFIFVWNFFFMFKRYTHFYAKSCVYFNLSKTAIKHVNFIFLRFDYRYPNVNNNLKPKNILCVEAELQSFNSHNSLCAEAALQVT